MKKQKEDKDKRQERFEKVVEQLKLRHREILSQNNVRSMTYVAKCLDKEDRNRLLKSIKNSPMTFLSMDEKTLLDYGFCADAMETAQKAYAKQIYKSKSSEEDRENLIHSFEELETQHAVDVIAEDEAKREEKIRDEKFERFLRLEKKNTSGRNKGDK